MGLPRWLSAKESAYQCRRHRVWSLGREDSPGGKNGSPLQYSCLENSHGQRRFVGYSPMGLQRVGRNWSRMHPKSLQMVTAAMKLKDAYSLEGKLWPTEIAYSKAEILLCQQRSVSQGYGFSCGHVWMRELVCEESWARKNWCFCTVVLEKTLESPLDCKEIHQSILKEISPGCSLEGMMLKLKL